MQIQDYNKEVETYLSAITEACFQMDFKTFDDTIVWFAYDPLAAKSWTKRMLAMIDNCQKAQLAPQDITRLFPSMSQLRNMMLFDLWMSKYAQAAAEDRKKIFTFYAGVLNEACLEDPHAFEFKNVIHTDHELDSMLSGVKPATPEIAKTLGRLLNACYHFGHAAYSDMNPSIVYENYGPYDVSDQYGPGHIAVVKEFNNLRPVELWPNTAALPCKDIKVVCVYKDVKVTIDNISHVVYEGDLINNLKHFRLIIDGVDFPIERLDEIIALIEMQAGTIFQEFQGLDFEARKEKYFHQKAYAYKDIYERLGQDWRPHLEILAEAKGKPLCDVNWPDNKDEQKKLFKQIADPRVDCDL